MSNIIPKASSISRRTFLRGSGVAMALPFLDAMRPVFGAEKVNAAPRRMVCLQTNQGIMPQFFFPKTAGKEYESTPYLDLLKSHRKDMTVFSGVSFPGVDGAHAAEKCFLTATPHPARGGFKNGISVDQFAAERLGFETRYPSLVLAVTTENQTLSYTGTGAPIPSEQSPKKLFQKLFLQGSQKEIEANVAAIKQGRSMMDFVGEESKRLQKKMTPADKSQLDNYFTSVRTLEKRMKSAEEWEHKPKPKVTAKCPQDITDGRSFVQRSELMFDMIKLALETDSTRIVSMMIDTTIIHNLTHHGHRPEVVAELRSHEEGQLKALNKFLDSLSGHKEGNNSLLDNTMVLYGTCMGSANSHSNVNLPVLLAGGGFKHGQHLAFDTKNNYPLSNVFVSMLQRLGIETGNFSTGKSTMRGLEFV